MLGPDTTSFPAYVTSFNVASCIFHSDFKAGCLQVSAQAHLSKTFRLCLSPHPQSSSHAGVDSQDQASWISDTETLPRNWWQLTPESALPSGQEQG